MPIYQVTVTPHSSLFLARERGNRAMRRSYPYIPASTASGALNTHLYQIGRAEARNLLAGVIDIVDLQLATLAGIAGHRLGIVW